MEKTLQLNVGDKKVVVNVEVIENLMKEFDTAEVKKSKVIDYEVEQETKTKRNYVRIKQTNNKRTYAESMIEEEVDGEIVRYINMSDKVINGRLNPNYLKGEYMFNENTKSGETHLGLIFGCFFGSEGEKLYNEPKFSVYRVNKDLTVDKSEQTRWKLESCKPVSSDVVIDLETPITIF